MIYLVHVGSYVGFAMLFRLAWGKRPFSVLIVADDSSCELPQNWSGYEKLSRITIHRRQSPKPTHQRMTFQLPSMESV